MYSEFIFNMFGEENDEVHNANVNVPNQGENLGYDDEVGNVCIYA